MAFKLDMSKFKKIGSDKTHTTMQHDDGHVIKIAHNALSAKMKSQFHALPTYADGGVVKKDDKSAGSGFGTFVDQRQDPDKAKDVKKGMTKAFGYADGGKVEKPLEIEPVKEEPIEFEAIEPEHPVEYEAIKKENYSKKPKKKMAEGGAVDDTVAPAPQPQGMATPPQAQMQQQSPNLSTLGGQIQQSYPLSSPQAPVQQPQQAPAPDAMGGYEKQVAGALMQAGAEDKAAVEQVPILKAQAGAEQKLKQDYDTHLQALNTERESFMKDINAQHIDPNRYLGDKNTGQKIGTAIGLILGGIGGGLTHGGNTALQFLNSQIDRDIDAQKANIGKSENLLSANMKQFGNLRDATDMTRIMMNDMTISKLKVAAAQAQSPMAQAAALKAIGSLEQQVAPMAQQMAIRKSLANGGTDVSKMDPATLVSQLVPSERQKDVLHEISLAQNTAKNSDELMRNFDKASKENTILKTGAGLARIPASILSMRAMMLPIIHDAEGRVNEFEQKTTSDLEPKPGDTESKIAEKRQALKAFLTQKSSAPNAKAYGLDLDKFASTSDDKTLRLDPQQQSFANWAKQNPQDPRSALILKKLGI